MRIMEAALTEQSTPTHSVPERRPFKSALKRGEEGGDYEDAMWTGSTSPSTLENPRSHFDGGSPEAGAFGRKILTDAV